MRLGLQGPLLLGTPSSPHLNSPLFWGCFDRGTVRAPAELLPVVLQLRSPLPSPAAGNQSPSVSRPAPAVTGEIAGTPSPSGLGWRVTHRPSAQGVRACSALCSDSDSDVDRISEWKRRDEERRRELEEKRKREQEEEIRRLREQEKEEKEKRKEKAEKSEEMHSDSDSSAEDEVAKKGRKGRAKAPSSSDSELELEKEVRAEPWGAGDKQPVLTGQGSGDLQERQGPAVPVFFHPGVAHTALGRVVSIGSSSPGPGHPIQLWVSHLHDTLPPTSHRICSTALPGARRGISGIRLKHRGGLQGARRAVLPVVRGEVALLAWQVLPRGAGPGKQPEDLAVWKDAWVCPWVTAGWVGRFRYQNTDFWSSALLRWNPSPVLSQVGDAPAPRLTCRSGGVGGGGGAGSRPAGALPPSRSREGSAALACIVLSSKVKKPAKKQPSELSRKPNQKEKRGRAEEKPRNKSASPLPASTLSSSGARAVPCGCPALRGDTAGWGWGSRGAAPRPAAPVEGLGRCSPPVSWSWRGWRRRWGAPG